MKKLTNVDLANLLKNDVKSFNAYREKYPNQKIDFTKLDNFINFKNSNLDDANLSNMNLEGLNFADSNMRKVKLKESNISNCDYRGANVELSNFDNSILHDSDFRGSNLTRKQMLKAQCSKRSGWSDETYSGEISELFVPFFILIFFAILATFLFLDQ
jgi:uncharacterized protein YjbI with pentapeptide repeats